MATTLEKIAQHCAECKRQYTPACNAVNCVLREAIELIENKTGEISRHGIPVVYSCGTNWGKS